MDSNTPTGARKIINGQLRVHYLGYWVKVYDVPADTLLAKRQLIEALTRRLFNHVEHGINIPGKRLDEARRTFRRGNRPTTEARQGGHARGRHL